MKRLLAILFLSAVLMQSLSGLLIIGHFYYRQAYIAENFCENRFDAMSTCGGKCYLNKELKAQEKQDQKLPDLKIKPTELFFENENLNAPLNQFHLISLLNPFKYIGHAAGDYRSSIFQPPRAA